MLPDIRQFLEDHKIADIDQKFEEYSDVPASELDNYTFVMSLVGDEDSYPFFKQQNTVSSIHACGDIYKHKGDYNKAIEYYKLCCEMNKGNNNGDVYCSLVLCYGQLGDKDGISKYLELGAMSGNIAICRCLGTKFEGLLRLRESRCMYKTCGDHAGQTRVEQKLLAQFGIQLNKQDYLFAYELIKKYNTPGGESLRSLINKEYFEVLGLIKDLSNIVVSYLI